MKYPIGLQDFASLREDGYVYVDKTETIRDVSKMGKFFFLSRPRRFGKSLLISTLHELYSGREELFKGLWAEDNWDWTKRHPIIWLKFAIISYQSKGLEQAIRDELHLIADEKEITLSPDVELKDAFRKLIKALRERDGKVVLLIDEYDKPLIDYLDDLPQLDANRAVLKQFYSVLKDSDPDIEFAFITGVSAFSKVSLFSDLNNLHDISLSPIANNLVGISASELEANFSVQLDAHDRERVKRWYNGYNWLGKERIYNPFSLLLFFAEERFRNYWFQTGTPTFLIKEMKKRRYYNIERMRVSEHVLTSFDPNHLNPVSVLFQTGYLTIIDYDDNTGIYTLDYPNLEVRQSLQLYLLDLYLDRPIQDPKPRIVDLRDALNDGNIEAAIEVINTTLADLPYDLWQKDTEHFYHAIVHLIFSLLGTFIRSEVHSARGRADAIVETDRYVYVLEFKRDLPAQKALEQIRKRGYLERYADDPRQKIAVGISFSTNEKRIVSHLTA